MPATYPDSPFLRGHVEYLRAAGETCLRQRRFPMAKAFYVLAARWTRFGFRAVEMTEADDAATRASLARESVRLSGRIVP